MPPLSPVPLFLWGSCRRHNWDPLVALEPILGERNPQLWKIIEKQRGMYNNLHKELDRAKAERDRLQSKSSGETLSNLLPFSMNLA